MEESEVTLLINMLKLFNYVENFVLVYWWLC